METVAESNFGDEGEEFEDALERTANQLGDDLAKVVMGQQENIAKYAQSFVAECNAIMKEVYLCDPECADNCSSDFTRFDPVACSRCACATPFKVSQIPNFYQTAHSMKYSQLKALSSKSAYVMLAETKEAPKEGDKKEPETAAKEDEKKPFNMLYVLVPAVVLALAALGFFLYKKSSDQSEGGQKEDLYTKFLEC
jgi:hypothetical protein